MREYKFRGKCVERDKWVYGYYVKGIQEDEAYILKNHNWLLGDDFIKVVKPVLCVIIMLVGIIALTVHKRLVINYTFQ